MENVVLGKDFSLGVTSSFFHTFTHVNIIQLQTPNLKRFDTNKCSIKPHCNFKEFKVIF